jgi:hypothetical protein
MTAAYFDPLREQLTLFRATTALGQAWGRPGMAAAFTELRATLARAEHALAELEREPERDAEFAVQVLGLGFQIAYAQAEIERAERFARETLAGRSLKEETPGT